MSQDPIKDSRHLLGPGITRSPDEVRARWQAFAQKMGEAYGGWANRPGETDLLQSGEEVEAYVNENRWLAQCLHCNACFPCWWEMPDACCYDCGRVYTVKFPKPKDRALAESILSLRPRENRHWKPDKQSTASLKEENASHGFPFLEKVK